MKRLSRGPWEEYEVSGRDYIPVHRWGKDHWSTLAYCYMRAIDHKGVLDSAHMRTHARLHRQLVGFTPFGTLLDGSEHPTRAKDGTIERHDDWSCLEDIVAHGLAKAWTGPRPGREHEPFGCLDAKVQLTALGFEVAQTLMTFKAAGGNFAQFGMGHMDATLWLKIVLEERRVQTSR